jgi:glycosyltransferase involved in cell wall biosynthesis
VSAGRIVAVAHSPWLGGAERSLLELVGEIARRPGREIHVLLPQPGPLAARLRAVGAHLHLVPARWWARDAGAPRRAPDLAGVRRTAAALRRLRPDVVLSNTMVHPPGALAARVLGLPHLWWVHELGRRDHGYAFPLGQLGTVRAIGLLSSAVIVSSGVVRAELERGIAGRRLRDVPYAVEIAAGDARPPEHPPRLVIAGRVRPSKGQADAVAALVHLPGVGLDVAGDGAGADIAALRGQAEALGVADRVRLLGPLADPAEAFDRATVALMCSREEAFGRVTVEAMKRGRPVVGAASGGTLEIVEDGVTGVLYPPGDVAALAAAVAGLLADPVRREAIARAGAARALATYSAARSADAFLAVADEVAA